MTHNQAETEIQAGGNYWGATNSMAIDRRIYNDEEDKNNDGIISGKVIFEPYLHVAPQ